MKLEITQGEWVYKRKSLLLTKVETSSSPICTVSASSKQLANAELIADAGTTANKCGLLPSELLVQRDELLEALQNSNRVLATYNSEQSVRAYLIAQEAINKTV